MADIFIRKDTGEEFELDSKWKGLESHIFKPLPKQAERRWLRIEAWLDELDDESRSNDILDTPDLKVTEEQAGRVVGAIKSLLEYIHLPYDYDNPSGYISSGRAAVFHKAREAVNQTCEDVEV